MSPVTTSLSLTFPDSQEMVDLSTSQFFSSLLEKEICTRKRTISLQAEIKKALHYLKLKMPNRNSSNRKCSLQFNMIVSSNDTTMKLSKKFKSNSFPSYDIWFFFLCTHKPWHECICLTRTPTLSSYRIRVWNLVQTISWRFSLTSKPTSEQKAGK